MPFVDLICGLGLQQSQYVSQNKLAQGITLRYEVCSGGLFGLLGCYRLCVAKGYAFRRLDLWFRFATKPIRITKQVDAGYNPALRNALNKVTKPKVLPCATKCV